MNRSASWWIKVKRAQHHMVELHRAARAYHERKPYVVEPIKVKGQGPGLKWVVRFVEQPDPQLAAMLGDFVHNLRSALDHIVVASVPKKERENASFPVREVDIWARDANGEYVSRDNESREAFRRAVSGIHPDALTYILAAQPYALDSGSPLSLLSRMDNTDKHQRLILMGRGIENPVSFYVARGQGFRGATTLRRDQFADDGAIIRSGLPDFTPPLRHSEVDVQLSGTVVIGIQLPPVGRQGQPEVYRLPTTLNGCIRSVRLLLRYLEPFALPD